MGERILIEVLRALRSPNAERRREVSPGEHLAVGRTGVPFGSGADLRSALRESANWVLPGDSHLSGRHFSLSLSPAGVASILDLGSAEGTFVNGERTTAGDLRHGDWIRAGQTDFLVFFEGGGPERAKSPVLSEAAADAHAVLGTTALPLFAVLDAARDARILPLLRQSVDRYASLYEGDPGKALERWAPHLVLFRDDSDLLLYVLSAGWGERWGTFFTSGASFPEIRRHFRRFLLVEDGDTGQPMYFRFYDPAVLRVFLSSVQGRQRETFFGPIASFLVEGEAAEVLRFDGAGATHGSA